MTNQLTNFTFQTYQLSEGLSQKHDIRVVTIGGDPWFVLADVCVVLGLKGYPSQHGNKLDNTERMVLARNSHVLNTRDVPSLFDKHAPTITLISESGLYKLIMRSDKQQAKAFQDWVTREVLPAIRKDGGYITGEEKLKSGEMSEDEFVMKAMTILQGKVDRITKERDEAVADLGAAHKTIGHSQHTISRFARTLLGVNTQKTKQDLQKIGYLYRKGGTYRVYSKYQHLFEERFNETFGGVDIFVTAKGKERILRHFRQGQLTSKKGF